MSSLIDAEDDTSSPSATLSELQDELNSLEATLKPLLERPWRDTMGDIEDHLQKAKIGVMTAYTICDLIWSESSGASNIRPLLTLVAVFLRTKGVDSTTHPVMRELDRIKGYYMKVKEAETAVQAKSDRSTSVNLPAAARVIKHALPPASKPEDFAGPGMHSRFKHVDREGAEVEKVVPGESSTDDGLEVVESSPVSAKTAGKRRATDVEEEQEEASPQRSGKSTRAPAKVTKTRKTAVEMDDDDKQSARRSKSSSGGTSKQKKQKKT